MKVIEADHDRRLLIPGVPGVARRPVDIDEAATGFKLLRTLRIYRFDAGAVVNGHAEEDEVYVVVLSGSMELTISEDGSEEKMRSFTLAAASEPGFDGFVAYLPPHSSYRLTPLTETDVAYARATPLEARAPAVFRARVSDADVDLLLDESTHASRLRLRVVHVHARQQEQTVALRETADAMGEALAYVRSTPADRAMRLLTDEVEPVLLRSWDTVALGPGDRPFVEVAKGALVAIVTVLAG